MTHRVIIERLTDETWEQALLRTSGNDSKIVEKFHSAIAKGNATEIAVYFAVIDWEARRGPIS